MSRLSYTGPGAIMDSVVLVDSCVLDKDTENNSTDRGTTDCCLTNFAHTSNVLAVSYVNELCTRYDAMYLTCMYRTKAS